MVSKTQVKARGELLRLVKRQRPADASEVTVTLVDGAAPNWNAEIDRIGAPLGAPDNPTLFPYHFLQVVLPRIGGRIAVFHRNNRRMGVGFLFPRGLSSAKAELGLHPERLFTLRYHALDPAFPSVLDCSLTTLEHQLGGARVVPYDPTAPQEFGPTHRTFGELDIGRPDRHEATAMRQLHRQIWSSPPEFLYPTDMHGAAFSLGTSLVARVRGEPAGFLFGFYKFQGRTLPADWHQRFDADLRLESQILGVLPEFRGMRIANLLKRVQAEQAWGEGIGIVNWTADPLQFPNAALNFSLLKAVAFDFYADLYPFRNYLNRVPASRFGVTWLVGSERVRTAFASDARGDSLDLASRRDIVRVNRGWSEVDYTVEAKEIAIEIPADWTALQQEEIDEAVAWREATDKIFARYVGQGAGQYVITGVGVEGDRRYLVGEQAGDDLWSRLASGETD